MKRHLFATGKGRDRKGRCWCGELEHKAGEFIHTRTVINDDGEVLITGELVFEHPSMSSEQIEEILSRIKDKK